MADPYHFPPDLLELLVEGVASTHRGKQGVIGFFKGAGSPSSVYADIARRVAADRDSISKAEIVRTVLERLNDGGDHMIRARREVVRRMVEFEDFSSCWPADRYKAEAVVARIRKLVDLKDTTTRLEQARDQAARDARSSAQQARVRESQERQAARHALLNRMRALVSFTDPHLRGKELERLLNEVFRQEGILVREAFERRDPQDGTPLEQVDGVIELKGGLFLVEVKWWTEKIGPGPVGHHLSRVFTRSLAGGIVISASGFTAGAVDQSLAALSHKQFVLIDLGTIIATLEREVSLAETLVDLVRTAQLDRNPYPRPR